MHLETINLESDHQITFASDDYFGSQLSISLSSQECGNIHRIDS
jgi:hypothetical protein